MNRTKMLGLALALVGLTGCERHQEPQQERHQLYNTVVKLPLFEGTDIETTLDYHYVTRDVLVMGDGSIRLTLADGSFKFVYSGCYLGSSTAITAENPVYIPDPPLTDAEMAELDAELDRGRANLKRAEADLAKIRREKGEDQ